MLAGCAVLLVAWGLPWGRALDGETVVTLVPIVVMMTATVQLAQPTCLWGRRLSRWAVLAAGVALSVFFVVAGLRDGAAPAWGFYAATVAAVMIATGAVVSLVRRGY